MKRIKNFFSLGGILFLLVCCSLNNNSNGNIDDNSLNKKSTIKNKVVNANLIDSLKKCINEHRFKQFEKLILKNNLGVIKRIFDRKYLIPNEKINKELKYLIFKYYVLFAYNDYKTGIQHMELLEYDEDSSKYDAQLKISYRNMKTIEYANAYIWVIMENWEELKSIKEQNQNDFYIDYMYYFSKACLYKYINDPILAKDTLNQKDILYLQSKVNDIGKINLDYLRLLIKVLSKNRNQNEIVKLKAIYSNEVSEYYDFSITENYNFEDTKFVNSDEVKKIWSYGNFTDSLIGNLLYLNNLIESKKLENAYKLSIKYINDLDSIYDFNEFMMSYRNHLIINGAKSLFMQSKFSEYFIFIDSKKYELKYYDLDESEKFEKFTYKFYLKYYKGTKEFKYILEKCKK